MFKSRQAYAVRFYRERFKMDSREGEGRGRGGRGRQRERGRRGGDVVTVGS